MATTAITPNITALDQLCINTIRFLSVDAVEKADSGHPGMPLGAAPMAYVLWTKFLRHAPEDPHWFNRDRFVLSAGHGSMLLYSLLYLTGYDLSLEDIQQFRQWGSKTPGHPERGHTPGVEVTTGPLGQGFANGVGLAMAEAYLAAKYNRPGDHVVDHYTYAIVSDGDLMEGVASEAASLAGHLRLGKLIYLYDDNKITLASSTNVTFTEDHAMRFQSYGWHTQQVEDGNDLAAIEVAIRTAQEEKDRPSLILVRTHIGYGSPKQDTCAAHGSPLGPEAVKATKEKLGWPLSPDFLVPDEALQHFREAVEKGKQQAAKWEDHMVIYSQKYPELAHELRGLIHNRLPKNWDEKIQSFEADSKGMATRAASGKVIQQFFHHLPGFIGGSADLNTSTNTEMKDAGNFESIVMKKGDLQGAAAGVWGYDGRNIQYGVREHAMGAISNGLAAHGGIIPFTATFLNFADYMRPPIRLAALSKLKVIFVYTHDSVALGEDGPTHQPVEILASLRAIPNLVVIRPGDANETAVAWKMAIEIPDKPVALIFTRQHVPTLDRTKYASAEGLNYGGYILSDAPKGKPQLILIATGSEVDLAVNAQERLTSFNIPTRVVSMPSWELFDAQTQEYRDMVLPPDIPARISIEAGIAQGWEKYTGQYGVNISIEHFGASAPGPVVMREFGFTVDNICERALALLKI
ncbi:transketolase [Chitinophaga silvatica]|uniref:Transketolase n=1 Tax=Chitinophaga silvatica TaxID=2282649 RepID=A0A3E1Y385_9BACT|nr:transketolase [Chitinophaga silvatica]RFS19170.1 transketolase [Chitinophaga silvatica]